MSIYRFTLIEDSIVPGGTMHILTGGANRAVFCLQGSAGVEREEPLYKQEAAVLAGGTQITTGHEGTLLWRWELALEEDPEEVESTGVTSRVLSEVTVELEDGLDYLMRVESLGLPPKDRVLDKDQTGHALSACLQGSFLVTDQDGEEDLQNQAEAWYQIDGGIYSLKAHDEEPSLLVSAVLLSPDQQQTMIAVPVNENGDGEDKRFDKVLAEGFAAL